MSWKVDQSRGSWTATVVLIGDRDYEYLRDQTIAVVLDDNVDWKRQHFQADEPWWQGTRFDQLIENDAVILVRKHLGFDDNGASIVGRKIALIQIDSVERDGDRLRFNFRKRLKGRVD